MAGCWQAGAPALTLARERRSAIECDDMTVVDGFGSTCDVVVSDTTLIRRKEIINEILIVTRCKKQRNSMQSRDTISDQQQRKGRDSLPLRMPSLSWDRSATASHEW